MRLEFNPSVGRSQLLALEGPRNIDDAPNFVGFVSPTGNRTDASADRLLDLGYVMLGVATRGNAIGLYHAALIDNIDAREIDDPIHLITMLAQVAEQELRS